VEVERITFETCGFRLHDWQREAVEQWQRGDEVPYRGTLEIFTGGGKTLIALACAAEAAKVSEDFKLIIIVPTIALADQWAEAIARYTNVERSRLLRVAESRATGDLGSAHALVVVINTAAKLYRKLNLSPDTMLIVDECHRAGAPTFRSALNIQARFRLGLSATPEREEVDEEGEPLRFDEQIVAKRLGRVVFSFNLADARRAGWLPEYRIVHHGLSLTPHEQLEYDRRSRRVDDLADRLRQLGVEPSRARTLQARKGEVGEAARAYLAAIGSRKDLLYRANERTRIARGIVMNALSNAMNRVIVFNERITGATKLFESIEASVPNGSIALEHSRLAAAERRAALDGFRDGSVRVLVSAKSLIEGIDVPAANVGVSVASTGSVRQRIQALGRVLRRYGPESLTEKKAEMHLLYISDTVDETIYEKEDWSDLTGESLNEFLRWPLDPNEPPERVQGPPRVPKPTEEQEYDRLRRLDHPFPSVWTGAIHGQEYHVDTWGNVANAFGTGISNAQGVGDMLRSVRGRPGGKFFVTPRHRVVIVSQRSADTTKWYAAGLLQEAFIARRDEPSASQEVAPSSLRAGAPYSGPQNADHGQFNIRSRSGGSIELQVRRGVSEFALTDVQDGGAQTENAVNLLDAWREHIGQGISFSINDRWDAWYRIGGVPRFLAHVPGGFRWPQRGPEL